MKLKDFKMTFDQFAALIESDPSFTEFWVDTRGCDVGNTIREDVESYIREYQNGEDEDDQAIMYWLLVEMNVIDVFRDVDPLVQKFVDKAV